jgi:polyisoprenoid-binding protein YceI
MNNTTARLGMAVALALLIAAPAFAGPKDWKVDSGHSYGVITTEARINQSRETVTLGATRVTGTLRFDPEQVANSSFQFDVDPAGSSKESGSYSVLKFRSQSAELEGHGKLRVTGLLTVTEVQLEAQLEGNEAYSGPQYTGRVVKETTREQSFLLALPGEEPVDAQGNPAADVTAQAKVSSEDFPELVNAVLRTNWPAISHNQSCTPAAGGSEDYAGVTCSGSAPGQRSITRTASSFGEDYPGESGAAQAGNIVTLALHLRLTPQDAAPAAAIGQ